MPNNLVVECVTECITGILVQPEPTTENADLISA